MTLLPDSPCEANIIVNEDGGIRVEVFVPTYSGGVLLVTDAQRDADGDWRVFMPDTDDYDESNGIIYLGAPDIPVERAA